MGANDVEQKDPEWAHEQTDVNHRYTDRADHFSDVDSYDLDEPLSHPESLKENIWSWSPPWLRQIIPAPFRKSQFTHDRHPRPRQNIASLSLAILAGILSCLLFQAILGAANTRYHYPWMQSSSNPTDLTAPSSVGAFAQASLVKPAGLKVVGIMFYGRPMFVNILNCYLQKNMVHNGGWLDEIHFIANTKHEEDLAYLDKLVEGSQGTFKRIDKTGDWTVLWPHVDTLAKDTIIVKVDDDVIYLHENAIPKIVTSVIAHPEAFAVAGNTINTPHSHFWQYHTGALLPYLPDDHRVPWDSPLTWRASQLPHANASYPEKFDFEANKKPKFNMTRWLPLPNTSRNLWKTPAIKADWPNPRGGATMFTYADEIESWAMAAQVHYSFLDHLEKNEVERYYTNFGNPDKLWDQQYERYSINFIAARAGKISRQRFFFNDEVCITMTVPETNKEPFLIDMGAVVSHYSFGSQHELLQTDVLDRYLAYANEMVCPADAQIVPMVSSMVRSGN